MLPNSNPQSTTQVFLDIYDITNNLVILKSGVVSFVLQVGAMNFGLLAEAEQDAVIYTYAALLNSLNYPIQIVVQSQTKDVTDYLNLLKEQELQASSDSKRERIARYRQFVNDLIKERNVLDKKFYVVVPANPTELGIVTAESLIPGKTNIDISTIEKSVILEKAESVLEPKRDHLISQFARIGLHARQLSTQEIIRVFYTSYNPEASEGQELTDTNQYTTPLVRASFLTQQQTEFQHDSQEVLGTDTFQLTQTADSNNNELANGDDFSQNTEAQPVLETNLSRDIDTSETQPEAEPSTSTTPQPTQQLFSQPTQQVPQPSFAENLDTFNAPALNSTPEQPQHNSSTNPSPSSHLSQQLPDASAQELGLSQDDLAPAEQPPQPAHQPSWPADQQSSTPVNEPSNNNEPGPLTAQDSYSEQQRWQDRLVQEQIDQALVGVGDQVPNNFLEADAQQAKQETTPNPPTSTEPHLDDYMKSGAPTTSLGEVKTAAVPSGQPDEKNDKDMETGDYYKKPSVPNSHQENKESEPLPPIANID